MSEFIFHRTIEENNYTYFQYLVDDGVDVNRIDDNGVSPLSLAISGNNINIFNALVRRGADINEKDSDGFTLVHAAVGFGSKQCLHELHKLGLDINSSDEYGYKAPIHVAIVSENVEMFKELVHLGADLRTINKDDPFLSEILIESGQDYEKYGVIVEEYIGNE